MPTRLRCTSEQMLGCCFDRIGSDTTTPILGQPVLLVVTQQLHRFEGTPESEPKQYRITFTKPYDEFQTLKGPEIAMGHDISEDFLNIMASFAGSVERSTQTGLRSMEAAKTRMFASEGKSSFINRPYEKASDNSRLYDGILRILVYYPEPLIQFSFEEVKEGQVHQANSAWYLILIQFQKIIGFVKKKITSLVFARSLMICDFIDLPRVRRFESPAPASYCFRSSSRLKCAQRVTLSPSWISSRSTTCGYTAAVDLCLNDSKDPCRHLSASIESRRVLARESDPNINTLSSDWGVLEDHASRELAIPWIVKSGTRLVVD
ncbi:hypothetical protein RF11_11303 [Thelohanellus kitauei]|uniref:Uncharacterized protein n=1 Tax=Thelohanellus kitauei TaxID=669202 RepID=A0A0C2I7M8_THEKT|nr:hypothetical protein RF11_11303 [Thelohanellus kitauei]